ncbi:radical SAM protein [Patescibacteria group bacterium]
MNERLSAPVDIQIELTQACNWNCFHCYNYWKGCEQHKRSFKSLSCIEIEKIINELVINKVPSITITGGEPFLRRKELYFLLKMAKEHDIAVSINTNFSLVTEDDIRVLKDDYPNTTILVSLLSAHELRHEYLTGAAKGTFKKVISNIETTVSQGLHISINMVLVRQNMQDLEITAQLAKKLGVKTFCATKSLPNTNQAQNDFILNPREVYSVLERLVKIEESFGMPVDTLGCFPKCFLYGTEAYHRFSHRVCVAAITTLTIGADGAVRPCSHMECSYGNIHQEALSTIWHKMSGWYKGEFIPEKCTNCQILELCRGSCRVNNLGQNLTAMDLYATPERVENKSKVELIPKAYSEEGPLLHEVKIHPNVKFRKESFGALIYRADKGIITLVNKKAASFLQNAADTKKTFTFEEFLAKSGAKDQKQKKSVEMLYRKLIRKGVLMSRK